MSGPKRRRLAMVWTPEVKRAGNELLITTGEFRGAIRYEFEGRLSVYCAVELIRKLRRGLREIRDVRVKELNEAVARAEGEL